jgi:hypothetical protein
MTAPNDHKSPPRLPGVRRAEGSSAAVGRRSYWPPTARQTVALAIGVLALAAFIVGIIHSGALAFVGAILAFVAIRISRPDLARDPNTNWSRVFLDPFDLRNPFRKGLQ